MVVYEWLVHEGGLWYAVVGWAVAWLSGLAVAWRPWKHHRKAQKEISAQLNAIYRQQRENSGTRPSL